MRITGRQLRRIIQEEVARMMNEEDGKIIDATGTTTVKPMAVTGNPDAYKKSAVTNLSINLMRAFVVTKAKPTPLVTVNEGDKIDVVLELVGIEDTKDFMGNEFKDSTRWSMLSLAVNGKNVTVPAGFKTKVSPAAAIPAGERMKFRTTFEITPALGGALTDNREDGGYFDEIRSLLFTTIKDRISAA